MYGGCIKGMHSEEGVVQCLRLWFGKTIGKSVGGPVILQINGDEVDIGSLDDISACINSYLSEKQLEISGSLSVRDEEQSVDESPKKALSLGQISLKGVSTCDIIPLTSDTDVRNAWDQISLKLCDPPNASTATSARGKGIAAARLSEPPKKNKVFSILLDVHVPTKKKTKKKAGSSSGASVGIQKKKMEDVSPIHLNVEIGLPVISETNGTLITLVQEGIPVKFNFSLEINPINKQDEEEGGTLEGGIYLNTFRAEILSALLSASTKSDVNDAKECLQVIGTMSKLYHIPKGNVRASTSLVSTTQDLLKVFVEIPIKKRKWTDNRNIEIVADVKFSFGRIDGTDTPVSSDNYITNLVYKTEKENEKKRKKYDGDGSGGSSFSQSDKNVDGDNLLPPGKPPPSGKAGAAATRNSNDLVVLLLRNINNNDDEQNPYYHSITDMMALQLTSLIVSNSVSRSHLTTLTTDSYKNGPVDLALGFFPDFESDLWKMKMGTNRECCKPVRGVYPAKANGDHAEDPKMAPTKAPSSALDNYLVLKTKAEELKMKADVTMCICFSRKFPPGSNMENVASTAISIVKDETLLQHMKRYINDDKQTPEAKSFGRILCKKPSAGFSLQYEVKMKDKEKRVYLGAECAVTVGQLVDDPDVSKPIMVEVSERVTVVSAVEDDDIM